jgi:hypothetical protein
LRYGYNMLICEVGTKECWNVNMIGWLWSMWIWYVDCEVVMKECCNVNMICWLWSVYERMLKCEYDMLIVKGW